MSDDAAEAILRMVEGAIGGDAVLDMLDHYADAFREQISVPVEFQDGYVIRSLPGEYPRTETGELMDSIFARFNTSSLEGTVGTSLSYATTLRDGGQGTWGVVRPRAMFREFAALEMNDLAERASAALAAGLISY